MHSSTQARTSLPAHEIQRVVNIFLSGILLAVNSDVYLDIQFGQVFPVLIGCKFHPKFVLYILTSHIKLYSTSSFVNHEISWKHVFNLITSIVCHAHIGRLKLSWKWNECWRQYPTSELDISKAHTHIRWRTSKFSMSVNVMHLHVPHGQPFMPPILGCLCISVHFCSQLIITCSKCIKAG